MNEYSNVVDGLEKAYKDDRVLNHIDFKIEKGKIFALLGENGAGKTTTIKILTTLLKPNKGQVQINGFDVIKNADKVRKQFSLTGQFSAVDDVLTGRENLILIGKLRHIDNLNHEVEQLLKQFDLLDACNRRVSTYSGGMKRRLDLAMSLLGHPSIIFLDEPTTGLDPQSRLTMWKIIRELKKSGVTIFLTTQYLEEADTLADDIAILHAGKIVARGKADELKQMLSHGHLELKFHHDDEMKKAQALFTNYPLSVDEENKKMVISTDGTMKQMTDILNQLQNSNINIVEFSQKKPTLEDVFLNIINDNRKGDKYDKEL